MTNLKPVFGPRGTNHERMFVDNNGRLLIDPTTETGRRLFGAKMALDSKRAYHARDMMPGTQPTDPVTGDNDDMSRPQQLAALLAKLSPEEKAAFLSLIVNGSNTIAEDDEETGVNNSASPAERNRLGIDRARRLAVDKAIKDHSSFTSRYGDRIKIDTMGVKW